tara:strand:- start:136 stop:453 length:318 start_codon:yes stop_codon:yes gene_type:complete
MKNKSLALRNKIYRFCFVLFSFFLFIYLFYFLINGEKGVLSYYKITKKNLLIEEKLLNLEIKNNKLKDKITRLTPKNIDLDFLDEQLRLNIGKTTENELIVVLDN